MSIGLSVIMSFQKNALIRWCGKELLMQILYLNQNLTLIQSSQSKINFNKFIEGLENQFYFRLIIYMGILYFQSIKISWLDGSKKLFWKTGITIFRAFFAILFNESKSHYIYVIDKKQVPPRPILRNGHRKQQIYIQSPISTC